MICVLRFRSFLFRCCVALRFFVPFSFPSALSLFVRRRLRFVAPFAVALFRSLSFALYVATFASLRVVVLRPCVCVRVNYARVFVFAFVPLSRCVLRSVSFVRTPFAFVSVVPFLFRPSSFLLRPVFVRPSFRVRCGCVLPCPVPVCLCVCFVPVSFRRLAFRLRVPFRVVICSVISPLRCVFCLVPFRAFVRRRCFCFPLCTYPICLRSARCVFFVFVSASVASARLRRSFRVCFVVVLRLRFAFVQFCFVFICDSFVPRRRVVRLRSALFCVSVSVSSPSSLPCVRVFVFVFVFAYFDCPLRLRLRFCFARPFCLSFSVFVFSLRSFCSVLRFRSLSVFVSPRPLLFLCASCRPSFFVALHVPSFASVCFCLFLSDCILSLSLFSLC